LNRVVITGFGAVTAFGKDWPTVRARMLRYENAVRAMPEWRDVEDLSAKLAAPIDGYAPPAHWTRKQLRSLGPVSQMCVEAGERALADAGLLDDPSIRDGRMGVASGSSTGSTRDICDMAKLIMDGRSDGFSANTYIRMMPHTTAANLAIFFGLQGRLIPTSSACTSGSQAIGYAYEAIRFGLIPMMLAGGGEELCHSEVCVFDSLYAASLKNDAPVALPAVAVHVYELPDLPSTRRVRVLSEQELMQGIRDKLLPHLSNAVAGMVRQALQKKLAMLSYDLQTMLNEETPQLVEDVLDHNLNAIFRSVKDAAAFKK